jgi:hypothetical protein
MYEDFQIVTRSIYDIKLDPNLGTCSREICKLVNIKDIKKRCYYKVLDVAPNGYSFVMHPENFKTLEITNGGYKNIIKYEKQNKVDIEMSDSKQGPNVSVGLKVGDIFGINVSVDNKDETNFVYKINNIENDTIILEYNGVNSSIFNFAEIKGYIRYIKIDKDVEALILKNEKQKALEYIEKKYGYSNRS